MIKINVNEDVDIKGIIVQINCHEINSEVLSIVDKVKDIEKKDSIKAYNKRLLSIVNVEKVYRIYSEDRVIYLETKTDKYTLKETLKVLEQNLTTCFARISNSEIVNVNKIKNLDLSYSGTIKINLTNNTSTYVSRRYIKNIKEKLDL